MTKVYKQTFLFIIGCSSMFYVLLTGHRIDFLDTFSPSPVVFSYGRDYQKREKPISFLLINADGENQRFRLTRKIYRSLLGPHHYKQLFYHYLIKSTHTEDVKFQEFADYYFCPMKVNDKNVKTVEVHLNKEMHKSYDCTK